MPTPYPVQITGAQFLSSKRYALLADEPRVGKTGAAIMACDDILAETVLVVTTASGRGVWAKAWKEWSAFNLPVDVPARPTSRLSAPRVVVSWNALANPHVRSALVGRHWDRIILDESHAAKNFDAKRTQIVYGKPLADGAELASGAALVGRARGVWLLTGTPAPNAPNDLYPMLRALSPERLDARSGFPDVTTYTAFLCRYCVVRMKPLPRGFQKIPVVVAGRNLEELRARLSGFMLRRTQAEVGIRQPIYETLPLIVNPSLFLSKECAVDREGILEAARQGQTKQLAIEMATLRRLTGSIKAEFVTQAVKDELAGGIEKLVLAYWHRDVGQYLRDGLSSYGIVSIDGSTTLQERRSAEEAFRSNPTIRVFIAQIQAAGEAIDLSAAADLIFVETSLVPKDMAQMSKRITNYTQTGSPRVRVAVLAGSIDEAVEQILLRKWSAIREVLKGDGP